MLFARERPRLSVALPIPAPLPSLTSALSRRSAIFGVVVAPMALAGSATCAQGLLRSGDPSHAPDLGDGSDTRLTAMAAEVDRTLDGAAYALAPDEPADQDARLYHAEDLMRRMSAIPAVGSAGVLAKAKAWLDSDSYDVQEGATLAESLCQDVERLFAAGGMARTEATGL